MNITILRHDFHAYSFNVDLLFPLRSILSYSKSQGRLLMSCSAWTKFFELRQSTPWDLVTFLRIMRVLPYSLMLVNQFIVYRPIIVELGVCVHHNCKPQPLRNRPKYDSIMSKVPLV